jgi:hypothetical protein
VVDGTASGFRPESTKMMKNLDMKMAGVLNALEERSTHLATSLASSGCELPVIIMMSDDVGSSIVPI